MDNKIVSVCGKNIFKFIHFKVTHNQTLCILYLHKVSYKSVYYWALCFLTFFFLVNAIKSKVSSM